MTHSWVHVRPAYASFLQSGNARPDRALSFGPIGSAPWPPSSKSGLRHGRKLGKRDAEPALVYGAQLAALLGFGDEVVGVLLQRRVGLAEGHAVGLLAERQLGFHVE